MVEGVQTRTRPHFIARQAAKIKRSGSFSKMKGKALIAEAINLRYQKR